MRFLTALLVLLLTAAVGFLAWQVRASSSRLAPRPEAPAEVDAATSLPEPGWASPGGALQPEQPKVAEGSGEPGAGELNRKAIEALEAGRLEEAVELFERCMNLAPEEPIFQANLAEALARLAVRDYEAGDDREQAIGFLERAVELAPSRQELADLLARWRAEREAEEGFASVETEHFILRFDYLRAELSEEFYQRGDLEQLLEETYHDLGESFTHFPVEAGRSKIEVVIYGRQAFDDVTGLGHWAGGVFDGTVRVPVDSLASGEKARLGRVLKHELLHAFAEDLAGNNVPGWLGEGLAQWVERRGGATVKLARSQIEGAELFALDTLQGTLATWSDPAKIRKAYAQSLALVDHMVRQFGEDVPFQMVRAVGQGKQAPQAFRDIVGQDLGLVLRDLVTELGARLEGQ